MKYTFILLITATYIQAYSSPVKLSCKGIDPTFTPKYKVIVSPFDVTFSDSYLVKIEERHTNAFPGPITLNYTKQGKGKLSKEGAGTIRFNDEGELNLRVLPNHSIIGELFYRDIGGEFRSNIELDCRKN